MDYKLYVFKMCFKVFSKISRRFQWFSNDMCQSIFKIPHKFQWFTNCVFQIMCFKVFSKISHRFQIMCGEF